MISARWLHKNPFDFKPSHKTFITTNHRPVIKGTDEAMWRRVQLIPFNYTFPEGKRDTRYREEKLPPELSGILNWALEGLRQYYLIGLNPPATVRAATREYREEMDVIGQWLEKRADISDPGAETLNPELYRDFCWWHKKNYGLSDKIISNISFGMELSKRGFEKGKSGERKRIRIRLLRWEQGEIDYERII